MASTTAPIDPWATPTPSIKNSNKNDLTDLWSTNSSNTNNNKPIATNPWAAVPPTIAATAIDLKSDPWATTPSAPAMTLPTEEVEFDELFSNKRVASPPNSQTNNNNHPFGDFFGGSGMPTAKVTNPWNENAEQQTTNKINQKCKTPESFLGENSSLVNLENLIPTNSTALNSGLTNNRPKSTNPFGGVQQQLNNLQQSSSANNLINRNSSVTTPTISGTTINPFAQQSTKAPPMNQLNKNSANLFPSFPTQATSAPFIQQQQPPMFMNSAAFPQQPFIQNNQPALTAFSGNSGFNQQSTNPFL